MPWKTSCVACEENDGSLSAPVSAVEGNLRNGWFSGACFFPVFAGLCDCRCHAGYKFGDDSILWFYSEKEKKKPKALSESSSCEAKSLFFVGLLVVLSVLNNGSSSTIEEFDRGRY